MKRKHFTNMVRKNDSVIIIVNKAVKFNWFNDILKIATKLYFITIEALLNNFISGLILSKNSVTNTS